MAKSAAIGNLFVNLGINSAEFTAGLKAAQASMGKFGKAAAVGFAAVAAAATAAGAALGVAVKGAIDHADELSKTAQKVGMSVEALSRLEYAAKLSDVSLEGLSTGLRKFSQVMVEAAGNGESRPAKVFGALGIAVKDAAGNVRDSGAVFSDVAARFAGLEDGALKTSLAVQLFGKSGADLIPLLNSGSDGLAQMAQESDRLGATISTKTAKSAEAFNDTLTRVGQVLEGATNKVMEAALPSFQAFADFLASPEFASAAQTFGTTLLTVLNGVAQAIVGVTNAARDLFEYLAKGSSTVGMTAQTLKSEIAVTQKLLADPNINEVARERSTAYLKELQKQLASFSYMDPVGGPVSFSDLGSFGFGTGTSETGGGTGGLIGAISGADEAAKVFAHTLDESIKTVDEYAKEIGDGLAGAFNQFADAVMSGVPAIEALSDVLGSLGKQLLNSAISGFFTNLFAGTFGTIAGGAPIPKTGFIPGITGPKLFAAGGISNGPAIFGESGPEAAVPLPDGRTIPVTLTGGGGYINVRVVNEVRNGNMIPVMTQVAGEVAGRKIKAEAPAAVAAAQRNRGMGG